MYPRLLLQVSPDVPDLWKTIVITLFILSLINERITNFIKLNIELVLTRLLGRERYERLFNCRTNFKLVEDDPLAEKNRERGIINLAIISGFVVAAACGADLLYLFKHQGTLVDDPLTNYDFEKWLSTVADHLPGYLLTAFFVSLGSKFWHDLLDLLLYSSNLKRRLTNEPELFRSGSAAEVVEFASLTSARLAQLALNRHEAEFRQHPDVVDVVAGQRLVDGLARDTLIVYLSGRNIGTLRRSVPVTLDSGRQLMLPVVYVPGYGQRPKALFGPGGAIEPGGSGFTGTLCCLLKGTDPADGQPAFYALTCSHVLTDNLPLNMGGVIAATRQKEVKIDQQADGRWQYGLLNRAFDVALIKLEDGEVADFDSSLNLQASPRSLTGSDLEARLRLNVLTRSHALSPAHLTGLLQQELRIEYGGGQQAGLAGLLELANLDSGEARGVTIGGDSGALVFDDEHRPVGMIVAGNDTHSYALSLPAILLKLRQYVGDLTIHTVSPN